MDRGEYSSAKVLPEVLALSGIGIAYGDLAWGRRVKVAFAEDHSV